MGKDSDWPEQCELRNCDDPWLRPHHHHKMFGKLAYRHACSCGNIDEPGTRPKDV